MISVCRFSATSVSAGSVAHANGYHTGAFVGSLILDPLDGTAPGFDRGFDIYDAGFRLRPPRCGPLQDR